MKMLSFIRSYVPNLYEFLLNTKEDILKNQKQLLVTIDFHSSERNTPWGP